jgi:hypothetical protein
MVLVYHYMSNSLITIIASSLYIFEHVCSIFLFFFGYGNGLSMQPASCVNYQVQLVVICLQ